MMNKRKIPIPFYIKCIFAFVFLFHFSDTISAQEKKEIKNDTTIYMLVETPPLFPGCDSTDRNCADTKMREFIYTNLKYPETALENWTEGVNIVNFVVEKDGSISYPKVIKNIGSGTKEESIRIVKSMPKFIPGKKNGQPVRAQYNLPIWFKME